MHLDKEILAQCINLGFDHDAMVDDVKCRRTTKGSVTYWLSLTSRLNNQSAKNDYLQRQLCETSQAQLQQPSGHHGADRGRTGQVRARLGSCRVGFAASIYCSS